jgi:hypothetical protein
MTPPCRLSSQIASNSFLSYDNKTNPYDAPFSNPNRPIATFVPNASQSAVKDARATADNPDWR